MGLFFNASFLTVAVVCWLPESTGIGGQEQAHFQGFGWELSEQRCSLELMLHFRLR